MLGEGLQTPPLRFPIYRDPDTQMFLETYDQTRVRGQETFAQRIIRDFLASPYHVLSPIAIKEEIDSEI